MRAILSIAAALPTLAFAGLCTDAKGSLRHDLQVFAGYSPASTSLTGEAPDRRFVLAGLSYSYRCWVWNSSSLSYTAAAMPAAIMLEPSHAVYGFGIASVGVRLDLARKRRTHPFVETLEGIIASSEPIPINAPNATGLNFLYSVGGGISTAAGSRRAVSAGYRFMHISNAGTTSFNPGVNNNVIYLGYSFLR